MRQPSHDEIQDTKQRSRSGSRKLKRKDFNFILLSCFIFDYIADVPQKRVDRHRSNGTSVGQSPNSSTSRVGLVSQLAEGSPLVPRRQLYSNIG